MQKPIFVNIVQKIALELYPIVDVMIVQQVSIAEHNGFCASPLCAVI